MARRRMNRITGRQLRAARVLAGLTQRMLGLNERVVRFWERKHDRRGVIFFAEPTRGARLAN